MFCFCVSSQHSSSIELSSHRRIDVDRRTRCTSGSSTTFLREFTSVNWLTKSVVRRFTMNFMIAGIDVAWIHWLLCQYSRLFVVLLGSGQSPFLRERCLLLGASVQPQSGLSAVVNELVASFCA